MAKVGEAVSDKDLTKGRGLLNDAARLTATSLNARILPDGSFGFDDENKAKLFNERLSFMNNLVEQDPSILKKANGGITLHSRAVAALPSSGDKPKEEAPKPAPKKPGGISALFGKGDETPKPAVGKPDTSGPTVEKAEMKTRVETVGWKYDPAKYEYRVVKGKLQRRAK